MRGSRIPNRLGKRAAGSPAVIDRKVLSRLRESIGEDAAPELIALYLEESLRQMDEMRRGFRDSCIEVVLRSSHSLKSSSALLGAMVFSDLCMKVEMMARDQDLTSGEKLLPALEKTYQDVRAGLEKELQLGFSTAKE